jgi:hypothetical protein
MRRLTERGYGSIVRTMPCPAIGPTAGQEQSMMVRSVALFAILILLTAGAGHADTKAANACAAKLSKDAKVIDDATLPQLTPGARLGDHQCARARHGGKDRPRQRTRLSNGSGAVSTAGRDLSTATACLP